MAILSAFAVCYGVSASNAKHTTDKFTVENINGEVILSNFDKDIASYVGHQSSYTATGTHESTSLTINVGPGEYGIVGGSKVFYFDDFYTVVGPGTYTFQVTDGFAEVVNSKYAAKQWQYRLWQTQKNKWSLKGTYNTLLKW